MHYSVTESSGIVEVVVTKKVLSYEVVFGVRTIDGTAKDQTEYSAITEFFTISKRETELTIPIKILDNNEWQPDLDFYVELFDP